MHCEMYYLYDNYYRTVDPDIFLLLKIQIDDGKDIIYKYKATDGSRQFKDIAKELEDKCIQDIIASINQLMTFTD